VAGFEKGIQDSKDRATIALATLPEIQQMIDGAIRRAQEARDALKGAEENADRAREMAVDAQSNYAERASKV